MLVYLVRWVFCTRTREINATQRNQIMEHSKTLISTMDITKDTPAQSQSSRVHPWFQHLYSRQDDSRKYDCDTCEHSFEVLGGRDEEECPGCDALITARAIKGKADSV